MNEVRLAQPAGQPPVASSSKGSVSAANAAEGKVLPEKASTHDAEKAPQAQQISVEQLKSEVEKVNEYVQTIQRDIQFSVDEESDRTVIQVVDSDSGDLIRQIPDDIFLELARRLKDEGEMNLFSALG